MLYRVRVDNNVGGLLKRSGITGVKEQMKYWPAGETAKAVQIGKQLGLPPDECAVIALSYVEGKKRDTGETNITLDIPPMGHLFEKSLNYHMLREQLD